MRFTTENNPCTCVHILLTHAKFPIFGRATLISTFKKKIPLVVLLLMIALLHTQSKFAKAQKSHWKIKIYLRVRSNVPERRYVRTPNFKINFFYFIFFVIFDTKRPRSEVTDPQNHITGSSSFHAKFRLFTCVSIFCSLTVASTSNFGS